MKKEELRKQEAFAFYVGKYLFDSNFDLLNFEESLAKDSENNDNCRTMKKRKTKNLQRRIPSDEGKKRVLKLKMNSKTFF